MPELTDEETHEDELWDETYTCTNCDQVVEPDWVAGAHVCFSEWTGPLCGAIVKIDGRPAAWFIDHHSPDRNEIMAHMIGDDPRHRERFDIEDITVIDGSEFCADCGALDCHWNREGD